jgi:heme A synthase
MELMLHIYNGILVILLSLVLAVAAWVRVRRGQPTPPLLRALQGVAHLLLTVQVLLGVGMLARGARIAWVHPVLGILALLSLLLPVVVPALKANRPLAAAVVPTVVTILATLAYGIGEMGVR